MLQRFFPHFAIITIFLYIADANQLVTQEPTSKEYENYTIAESLPISQIPNNEETVRLYNETNTIRLSPVFDVAQYESKCPPGGIVHRWSCEYEANLWKEYGENIKMKSVELCTRFQDVINETMRYSCWASPFLANSAINQASLYIQNGIMEFPENITNPLQLARKHEYTKSIDTIRNVQRALYLFEGVRELCAKIGYVRLKVYHLEVCKDILNTTKVYSSIEEANNLLEQYMTSYDPLVENLTIYLKQSNLASIFNSGELARLPNNSLYATMALENHMIKYKNIIILKKQNIEMIMVYVDSIVILLILTVGLTGNILLIAIFIKFKEMRTVANVIIMNLTVTDCISLLVNLPVSYTVSSWHDFKGRRTFLFICITVSIVSTYSIAMISLQRYLAVRIFPKVGCCTIGNKKKIILMTASVWVLALLYSITRFIDTSVEDYACTGVGKQTFLLEVTTDFVFICILPSVLLVVFSALTASNIKTSVSNVIGQRTGQQQVEKDRMLSAHVLTGLAILFIISYFPFHGFRFITLVLNVRFEPITNSTVIVCLYYLLFANSCLNPVALGIMSKKYRKCYIELIGCFKLNPFKLFGCQSASIVSASTT